MKIKICWFENHNPLNWYDELKFIGREETPELWEEKYNNGVKNIIESCCNAVHTGTDGYDGWIEVECYDFFEANSIEEIRKIIEEDYTSPECEIFTAIGEQGNRLFTEEDIPYLEMLQYCPTCKNVLSHFTRNNENVFGCYDKCKKEITGKESLTLIDLMKDTINL